MDYSLFKVGHFVSIGAMIWGLGNAYVKKNTRAYLIFAFFWITVLATSFGLVGALGLHENFPGWAQHKFHLWIGVGVMALLMKLKPKAEKLGMTVVLIFLMVATYFAVYKP